VEVMREEKTEKSNTRRKKKTKANYPTDPRLRRDKGKKPRGRYNAGAGRKKEKHQNRYYHCNPRRYKTEKKQERGGKKTDAVTTMGKQKRPIQEGKRHNVSQACNVVE